MNKESAPGNHGVSKRIPLPRGEELWSSILGSSSSVSIENARETPKKLNRLRRAYSSLPSPLQTYVSVWSETAWRDGGEFSRMETGSWADSMLPTLLYQNTDIIDTIIRAGIQPSKRNILALKERPDLLEPLSRLNYGIASLMPEKEEDSTKERLFLALAIERWTDRLLDDQAKPAHIPLVINAIQKISEQIPKMLLDTTSTIAQHRIQLSLLRTYLAEDILEVYPIISKGYFPTPNLIRFYKERGEVAFPEFEKLKKLTKAGRFDPENVIQRDLEWNIYLELIQEDCVRWEHQDEHAAYEDFDKVSFREEIETQERLTMAMEEHLETEAAAFEAANFFSFVKERASKGRKIAIIGNERYGAYFVVEPLRPYLEAENISVSTHYVHSGNNKPEDLIKIFRSINNHISNNKFDDIIIVDGTPSSFSDKTPRLPNALGIYAKALVEQGFPISHWVPLPEEDLVVGAESGPYVFASDQKPQIILANPVIDPARFPNFPKRLLQHKPGYMDDPEKFGNMKTEIVFTQSGLEKLHHGHTEEEFIGLVQSRMNILLGKYIRKMENGFFGNLLI